MLCTFTTEHGALIVRSDDIKAIEDFDERPTRLVYLLGTDLITVPIIGTARENAARIAQDELDMIGRVEAHRYETQKQLQAGYSVPPVQRGRK